MFDNKLREVATKSDANAIALERLPTMQCNVGPLTEENKTLQDT